MYAKKPCWDCHFYNKLCKEASNLREDFGIVLRKFNTTNTNKTIILSEKALKQIAARKKRINQTS